MQPDSRPKPTRPNPIGWGILGLCFSVVTLIVTSVIPSKEQGKRSEPRDGYKTSCASFEEDFSFRTGATAEGLYARGDSVASRLNKPRKRLRFNRFSLPCTSVHMSGA
jgi:hypothetical protein